MSSPPELAEAPDAGPSLERAVAAAPSHTAARLWRWLSARAWLWVLLGLTLSAGAIRFYRIDQPSLWGDEASTYSRVIGTYRQLLDILQYDGFTPLNYELYWWIAQGLPPLWGKPISLTPLAMRFVPAICGTLMVPAMYFLARQLAGRRVALLAAAFAAFSAYLLVYSRDAKMYMQMWLMVALHMGCLLWWLNTRRRVAWLGWIAAGLAAIGLQPSAMAILLVQPLLVLTARRHHWKHTLLMIIGLVVILAGPAGYYAGFNRWQERSGGLVPDAEQRDPEQISNWEDSGISWVETYQGNRTGPGLFFETASAFLLSYEWPENPRTIQLYDAPSPIKPAIVAGAAAALGVIGAILALGMLPWPGRFQGSGLRAWERIPESANSQLSVLKGQWEGWRTALWLAAWLMIPAYGFFYCRSVHDFVSPVEWLAPLRALCGECLRIATSIGGWEPSRLSRGALWALWLMPLWLAIALGAIFVWLRPRAITLALVAAAIPLSWLILLLITQPASGSGEGLRIAEEIRGNAVPWLLAGSAILLPPMAWYLCGQSLPQRMLKLLGLLAVAGLVFGACWVAYFYFDQQRQAFRDYTLAVNPNTKWESLWQRKWRSVWMPRYMGALWPALAIAVAALVMRLPTRPLKAIAIVTIVGLNLGNGFARILCSSEPPIDRMVADIMVANQPANHQRTFCDYAFGGGHPATGSLVTIHGRYYLAEAAQLKLTPQQIRGRDIMGEIHGKNILMLMRSSPEAIKSELARQTTRDADIRRIIVWTRIASPLFPDELTTQERTTLSALGPSWRRVRCDDYPIRYHWCWADLWTARRVEYTREP